MKQNGRISPKQTRNNIASIRALFPHCVSETVSEDGTPTLLVDFDLLRQELSEALVEGPRERYRLDWPGKRAALLASNSPVDKILRPCREESVDFDSTRNLCIEGDNLEALKLLQSSYLSSVDLMYIDPPYNTGEDFIYRDDFSENVSEHHVATGQKNSSGSRLVANLDSDGRFHSSWLSMMYSRLKVARTLLSKEGVIFISINDEEQDNLKKICDEIFGRENFLNTISVNMKNIAGASGGGEDKRLKKNIEYLHVYVRSRTDFPGFADIFDLVPINELVSRYRAEGKSWKYTSVLVEPGEKIYVGVTVDGDGNEIAIYERRGFVIRSIAKIMSSEGLSESEAYCKYASKIFQTTMPQSSIRPRVMSFLRENGGFSSDLYSIEYTPRSGRNKGRVYEQFYKGSNFRLFAWLKDVSEERGGILYKRELQGTYWDFSGDTKNLSREGGVPFPNGKKPLSLLRRIVEMQVRRDITVLDFFAGSGTMAHAVFLANALDGGTRRFIMVQLPERFRERSLRRISGKASGEGDGDTVAFSTIAALCRERIRRSGKMVVASLSDGGLGLDTGFRVFKVSTSNVADVSCFPLFASQSGLKLGVNHLKSHRVSDDFLFQVLLEFGLDLSLPLSRKQLCGCDVYFVGDTELAAFFGVIANEELASSIISFSPRRVVFMGNGFSSDSSKLRVERLFLCASPSIELKIL